MLSLDCRSCYLVARAGGVCSAGSAAAAAAGEATGLSSLFQPTSSLTQVDGGLPTSTDSTTQMPCLQAANQPSAAPLTNSI